MIDDCGQTQNETNAKGVGDGVQRERKRGKEGGREDERETGGEREREGGRAGGREREKLGVGRRRERENIEKNETESLYNPIRRHITSTVAYLPSCEN